MERRPREAVGMEDYSSANSCDKFVFYDCVCWELSREAAEYFVDLLHMDAVKCAFPITIWSSADGFRLLEARSLVRWLSLWFCLVFIPTYIR